MHFCHSDEIWRDYPNLVAAVLLAGDISRHASTIAHVLRFNALAASRLATSSEGELPEVQAWRRIFSRMGLKPTQYRCAAESLLRRFRKAGALPQLHPVVDLCNAISLAFAIPIAVFDVSKVSEYLEVRYATGSEVYSTFGGDSEQPEPHEVIFADGAANAHARRWTHRQSAASTVTDETTMVLIVAEAMHQAALEDVQNLAAEVANALEAIGAVIRKTALLSQGSPRFDW
jgi:DNA/RNA-binding domain of Phe-tRNA-synthetase-like protein